ncbi:hypothetical protein [Guptibacillus hwajinpoensis]|uniref:ATP-binding domain of ThiL/HypE-like (N-terminal domain) family protein n=1 Tax=Guptibacillus hwajinpoensis TaxID=208199 RepID=A0A0J6CU53_9BACL|nr:hypothetical protein [Alkalihalobacillus macyae]KMM36723.1 ATP-binding domain of ThiL/HypE-like (N-terminal domain) family protein [Alkalihalobacillus macyae]
MRDATVIPLGDQYLVIASDNSGGIGRKEHDIVQVPYDLVSYYSFRVAVMECLSLGATPSSVVMHNFCGDSEWATLVSGVERGIREIGLSDTTITGSSETNMPLLQSALGVVVIGKKETNELADIRIGELKFAVIGEPLVGEEVVSQESVIAPLLLFRWMCEQEGVRGVIPVGSKGILYELNQLVSSSVHIEEEMVTVDLDLHKSAGPSTCFIVAYDEAVHEQVKDEAGSHFYQIEVEIEEESEK